MHLEGGGLEVELALGVAEVDLQLLLRRADAAELVDEVHVPGGTPELPVGRRLQAHLLLQAYGGLDALVLDRAQLLVGDLAGGVPPTGLEQRGGPQQAADVVGAERWRGACSHGLPLSLDVLATLVQHLRRRSSVVGQPAPGG